MPPLPPVSKRLIGRSIVPTGRYRSGCGKGLASFGRTTKSEKTNTTSAEPNPNASTAAGNPSAHAPRTPPRNTAEAAKKPASRPTNASSTRLGRDNSSCAWQDGQAKSSDRDSSGPRGILAKHSGQARFHIWHSSFTSSLPTGQPYPPPFVLLRASPRERPIGAQRPLP